MEKKNDRNKNTSQNNLYSDEIKEMADYVTLSNDEDGVAHVINKFILEER